MNQDDIDELEFLRYYYRNVQYSLGPCDADINYEIIRDYKKTTGKKVSAKYDFSEDEE